LDLLSRTGWHKSKRTLSTQFRGACSSRMRYLPIVLLILVCWWCEGHNSRQQVDGRRVLFDPRNTVSGCDDFGVDWLLGTWSWAMLGLLCCFKSDRELPHPLSLSSGDALLCSSSQEAIGGWWQLTGMCWVCQGRSADARGKGISLVFGSSGCPEDFFMPI
jgi:hypothetical protein